MSVKGSATKNELIIYNEYKGYPERNMFKLDPDVEGLLSFYRLKS